MRKHSTEKIIRVQHDGRVYEVPASILDKYLSVTEKGLSDYDDQSNIAGGRYLRYLRIKAGYSCKQLAQLAGMDQSDIRKMELGKLSIGKTRAIRLAKVFNINFFAFISVTDL